MTPRSCWTGRDYSALRHPGSGLCSPLHGGMQAGAHRPPVGAPNAGNLCMARDLLSSGCMADQGSRRRSRPHSLSRLRWSTVALSTLTLAAPLVLTRLAWGQDDPEERAVVPVWGPEVELEPEAEGDEDAGEEVSHPSEQAREPQPTPVTCRDRAGCSNHGLCTQLGDGCVAASNADCLPSRACRRDDRCRAREGSCVASRASAVHPECSEKCSDAGRCVYADGRCFAGSDADCQDSRRCRENGECSYDARELQCDDGLDRLSKPLMVAGIVTSAVGGATIMVGFFTGGMRAMFACGSGWGHDSSSCAEGETIMAGTGIAGGVALLAGLPMLLAGARKVPRDSDSELSPDLAIGPTGGSLSWRF